MKTILAIFVISCNYFILFNCNNAIVAKPQSLENKNTAKTAIILSKRNICANKYVHIIVHMNYVHFNDIVNSVQFFYKPHFIGFSLWIKSVIFSTEHRTIRKTHLQIHQYFENVSTVFYYLRKGDLQNLHYFLSEL